MCCRPVPSCVPAAPGTANPSARYPLCPGKYLLAWQALSLLGPLPPVPGEISLRSSGCFPFVSATPCAWGNIRCPAYPPSASAQPAAAPSPPFHLLGMALRHCAAGSLRHTGLPCVTRLRGHHPMRTVSIRWERTVPGLSASPGPKTATPKKSDSIQA
mgnify:CR=1 FL=1